MTVEEFNSFVEFAAVEEFASARALALALVNQSAYFDYSPELVEELIKDGIQRCLCRAAFDVVENLATALGTAMRAKEKH